MAYNIVLDYTNDININSFLNSDKCISNSIHSLQMLDIDSLTTDILSHKPSSIILSTNIMSIEDMYALISGNINKYNYILCVGSVNNRKNKKKLQLLQEKYNCNIIKNVITDFSLLRAILNYTQSDPTQIEDIMYDVDIPSDPVGHITPEFNANPIDSERPKYVENDDDEDYTFD